MTASCPGHFLRTSRIERFEGVSRAPRAIRVTRARVPDSREPASFRSPPSKQPRATRTSLRQRPQVSGIVFKDSADSSSCVERPPIRGWPTCLIFQRPRSPSPHRTPNTLTRCPLPDGATMYVVKPRASCHPHQAAHRCSTLLPSPSAQRFQPPQLDLTFEGLLPTRPLPASVDFPLRRQDRGRRRRHCPHGDGSPARRPAPKLTSSTNTWCRR